MTACRNPSSPAVKAGVYTRISSDPSGQRAGVDRQRADCEVHSLARGWEVVEVFCDNDASAYGRKPRRAYERMLTAMKSGSIDAIVTWHNDRLHRSPKELEAFIDLVERSGVRLAVVTGGDYDLTTPDGRPSARIVGAVARKESEDRSRRVRRKHLELAEQGRPAGQLGWGVRSDEERELVPEAASRVLMGHGPDPRGFWAEADFQQRRDLVRLMLQRVEVMPGRPTLRRFDASRVQIQVSTLQPRGPLLVVPRY